MLAITLLFLNVPSLSQREFYFSLLSISSSPNLISKILIFSNNRDVLLLAAHHPHKHSHLVNFH